MKSAGTVSVTNFDELESRKNSPCLALSRTLNLPLRPAVVKAANRLHDLIEVHMVDLDCVLLNATKHDSVSQGDARFSSPLFRHRQVHYMDYLQCPTRLPNGTGATSAPATPLAQHS